MRYDSLLDAVGGTPLVGLPRLSPGPGRAAVGQAGGPQPDRLGQGPRRVLHGRSRPRRTACCARATRSWSPPPGNTGISLAMVASLRGYQLICVMPENTSAERGSCWRCTARRSSSRPPPAGPTRPSGWRRRLAAEHPDWVMLYQYGNEANARAHYETTGPELLADLPADHALRGRARHHRHADGHRPVPARARARRADRGGRAPLRRAGLRAAQHRRGLRARAVRRIGADHAVLGVVGRRAAPDPGAAGPRRASSPGISSGVRAARGAGLAAKAQAAGRARRHRRS